MKQRIVHALGSARGGTFETLVLRAFAVDHASLSSYAVALTVNIDHAEGNRMP